MLAHSRLGDEVSAKAKPLVRSRKRYAYEGKQEDNGLEHIQSMSGLKNSGRPYCIGGRLLLSSVRPPMLLTAPGHTQRSGEYVQGSTAHDTLRYV